MAMKVVRAIAHDQRHKPASQRQLDDALTNVVWNAVLDTIWLGMLVVQGFRPRPSQPVRSLRMADDQDAVPEIEDERTLGKRRGSFKSPCLLGPKSFPTKSICFTRAARSSTVLCRRNREVLHAEMMRVEVGGTQQPRCWRGAYEKRIGYQCG